MSHTSLRDLVAQGDLERIALDAETAAIELERARVHLRSAEQLVETDPIMAYAALYDATRKAVAAHMRAHGYRVLGKAGHHARTFAYARAALGSSDLDPQLDKLETMRRIRNRSEYDARGIGEREVRADLATAARIVAAVAADL